MRHEIHHRPRGAETAEVEAKSPISHPREGTHARGGDDFGDEVAAKGSPEGSVRRGINGAFAGAEEEAGGGVGGTGGENGAVANEGVVDEVG